MMDVPVIVISSSVSGVGKTIVALNLAAALWSDGFEVKLWSDGNELVQKFLSQRKLLCEQNKIALPMPEIINEIKDVQNSAKCVVIAPIPTDENSRYEHIFGLAHTLITVGTKAEDFSWPVDSEYVNLIWNTKKNIAARGIKYLNWIALLNEQPEATEKCPRLLEDAARRYGFRVAPPLHYREAFRYVNNGYCTADMAKFGQLFKMSMSDVYARREILTLTDFLWQNK